MPHLKKEISILKSSRADQIVFDLPVNCIAARYHKTGNYDS